MEYQKGRVSDEVLRKHIAASAKGSGESEIEVARKIARGAVNLGDYDLGDQMFHLINELKKRGV